MSSRPTGFLLPLLWGLALFAESALLHNLVSAASGREESVFLFLAAVVAPVVIAGGLLRALIAVARSRTGR